MTSPTTYEEALEVLRTLTALHSDASYFKKAEITLSDGFHGVDIWVEGAEWRKVRPVIQARVNRVPVCYIIYG